MNRWAALRLVTMVLTMLSFLFAGMFLGQPHPEMLLVLALIALGGLCNIAAHIATLCDFSGQLRWPHE